MITIEQLKDVKARVEALARYLDIDNKKIQVEEEQLRTQAPDFWNDAKTAEAQMRKVRSLKNWIDGYEEVSTEDVQETKKDTTKTSGMDLVRALLQNPPLIALMIADLSKWAFNFIVSGIAMYYFTYVAKDAGLLTTYILISNIFCVVGSYLAKSVAKKFSTRTGTIGTFILMAAVMIAANFLYTNVWLVVFLMSLAQLGYGIAYACTPAMCL